MMYDDFSSDYDRFVNWPARLAAELPFVERELQAVGAHRVLDAACGTGMHAVALAQRGYEVAGADLSTGMVERARGNAQTAGVDARFEAAGFGALSGTFTPGEFDAVLCLGNSLPHLLTPADLSAALADFGACLRPGGLLLIQNRNFDAVLEREARWMDPQSHREGEAEWLFVRFYDFEADGKLAFNMVTLQREGAGAWSQQITSTQLWPLRQTELTTALETTFDDVVCYGDMTGAAFDSKSSPNLVTTARRMI
ncbi:MAG: class I SAM-dependent methyltransferase [Chloroflexi bacterium]|nr:class I SAM-dependent methyltransferase [Chloroflexota bacterium]